MKFFISYSRSVKQEVRQVIKLLKEAGHDVWWDGDIPTIADWWAAILTNIEWCDIFIFIVSEKSVQSAYCLAELRYALARNRPIEPNSSGSGQHKGMMGDSIPGVMNGIKRAATAMKGAMGLAKRLWYASMRAKGIVFLVSWICQVTCGKAARQSILRANKGLMETLFGYYAEDHGILVLLSVSMLIIVAKVFPMRVGLLIAASALFAIEKDIA